MCFWLSNPTGALCVVLKHQKLIHIHTRRLRIQFLAGYLASSIIRPDDISAPNISPTAAAYIFDRHVNISRRKLPECICIDEVYAFSSSKGDYVCVLLDFNSQNVIDLLPSRRKYDLMNYLSLIPREERLNVKVVSTDMWETYRIVTKLMFPNAVNSLDKFHLVQEFNRRLERIRIDAMNRVKPNPNFKEINHSSCEVTKHREMQKQYYVLKKFNWLLLKNDDKISDPDMEKKYNRVLEGYYNYYDLVEYMEK